MKYMLGEPVNIQGHRALEKRIFAELRRSVTLSMLNEISLTTERSLVQSLAVGIKGTIWSATSHGR
jgi:hypothetical protein